MNAPTRGRNLALADDGAEPRQPARRVPSRRPGRPAPPAASGLDDLAWALRRRLAWPLAGMLAAGALALAAAAALPSRHAAQADLLLGATAPTASPRLPPGPSSSWPRPAERAGSAPADLDDVAVETERRLILSAAALTRVAARLDLAATGEFGPPPPGPATRLVGALESRVADLAGGLRGRVGLTAAAAAPPSAAPAPVPAAPPAAAPRASWSRAPWSAEDAATLLHAQVETLRQGASLLVSIRVESADPALALRIADALAEDYLAAQARAEAEAALRHAALLEARLDALERRRPALVDALAVAERPVAPGAAATSDAAPASGLTDLFEPSPPPTAPHRVAAPDAGPADETARTAGTALRALDAELALLDARLVEARIAAATAAPRARLAAAAAPLPHAPPLGAPALALALAAGLALGSGLAVLRESADAAPSSPAMAAADLGAPVLAALPPDRLRRGDPAAAARLRPGSPAAEGARRLRLALLADAPRPLTLAVLSPGPSEGRSTLAALLADGCARAGLRAVLVDADLRRPSQARRAGLAGAADLVSALEGEARLDEVLARRGEDGPWLLPAEPAPAGRADLVAGPGMADLIESLRARFDVVILDSPPLLQAPEARALAALADRAVVAARWGRTRREDLRAAARALEEAGVRPAGLALVGAPARLVPDLAPAPRADSPRFGRFAERFAD